MTLEDRAREWAQGDPDRSTADQLLAAIDAGNTDELEIAMGGALEFGTAGIRGEVGPGSNRMNRAVVIKTTKGLVDFLIERNGDVPERPVVVGFDARPSSRMFAEDTIGVLIAHGLRVVAFDGVIPTPIVAFAAKVLEAEAAVVVTASHNPPADNGYKVYDSNAAQIIPPTDTTIAEHIASTGPANRVLIESDGLSYGSPLVSRPPAGLFDSYRSEVERYRRPVPTVTVPIMYTPLHGVGGDTVLDLFEHTVHGRPEVVEEQFEPDGTFPTVEFPNPEERGALDLAIASATRESSELIIANDPDADRLAAAVPFDGKWRLFTGNELGVMLASHLLNGYQGSKPPITANSVVSSPMLSHMAAEHGARHLTTLTGFKWIVNAALVVEEAGEGEFLFGYEEALGYSVGRTVRDKDGISAALLLADLAGIQAEKGLGLLDYLASLWQGYGVWVSAQESLVRPGPGGSDEILAGVEQLASSPPREVSGIEVTNVIDYRTGADDRPPWLGEQALVEMSLGGSGRILARPSGTEPKLKIYVDLTTEAPAASVHSRREELLESAREVAREVADLVG